MATTGPRNYYDRNTALFLRIGAGGRAHALHRGLWGPGVGDAREAARHVHRLIAEHIRSKLAREPRIILDLGCGVGGTLFDLAGDFPDSRLVGVTVSPRQAGMARDIAGSLGLGDRCRFVEADFEQVRLGIPADVLIALESYTHATRPESFFKTCAEHLAEGGRLIVVDDFLAREPDSTDPEGRRLIETFRKGWDLPALGTLEQFDALAGAAGFVRRSTRNLSSLIRTNRPRDRLVRWSAPIAQRLRLGAHPFWSNVIGGNALNAAIRSERVTYCFVGCERS